MEMIEYDFSKVDPFRNYEKEIDNLDFNKTADGKSDVSTNNKLSPEMCATLRNILHDLRSAVTKIGGVVLNYGLRILNFIFEAIKRFPKTACGLLIIACIHGIARTIPILGPVLDALMLPFDVIIIASTVINDFIGSETFEKMVTSLNAAIEGSAL